MVDFDISQLQEMDKGTLSHSRVSGFKKSLKSQGVTYVPYFKRVGPGLSTLACELKRLLDVTLLPDFLSVLSNLTDKRFKKAFLVVRFYPEGQELDQWDGHQDGVDWNGVRLSVLVSFVLSIPSDDSLDSMTRMGLLGLFEKAPWNPAVKKLGKKGKLHLKLNTEILSQHMGEMDFDFFHPYSFDGFELEILIDGCPESDFDKLSEMAFGVQIQSKRLTNKSLTYDPGNITDENAETQIPILIAGIANALGVSKLDPSKLQTGDSLYALMGFDDTLSKSLELSIRGHFNVLSIVGGSQMITVGNAIEFAKEFYSNLSEDSSFVLPEIEEIEGYEGEMNAEGFRHGMGKFTWPDGSFYEGGWSKGEQNGLGKYKAVDGTTNEGNWSEGLQSGFGKCVDSNGGIYEGNWLLGNKDGQGKFIWPDGATYEGNWSEGLQTGLGKFIYSNGGSYEGNWRDGHKTGHGKLIWLNGDFYEGNWLSDLKQGQGKFVWATGSFYEGNWIEDFKDGHGRYFQTDGKIYEGNWSKNKQQGNGKVIFPNGDIFEGVWESGKRNGIGVMTTHDGIKTEETWANGEKLHEVIVASVSEELANVVSTDAMKSRDLVMTKHNIEVKISGQGANAFLYVLDEDILGKLYQNSGTEDPMHPLDVLIENDIEAINICYGIDINDSELHIVVAIDGKELKLDGVQDIGSIESKDEDYEELIKNKLLYNEENIFPLTGVIPKGMHALVVIERCKSADAIAKFEVNGLFSIEEFRLSLTNLDESTDFSNATYQLGLLEGMELNLKSLFYAGIEYKFWISGEDISRESLYLISRNADGDFEVIEDSPAISF